MLAHPFLKEQWLEVWSRYPGVRPRQGGPLLKSLQNIWFDFLYNVQWILIYKNIHEHILVALIALRVSVVFVVFSLMAKLTMIEDYCP